MNKDLVSIITPTYNGLPYMKQLAESLDREINNWPFEWIIVDNASDDGTSEWLSSANLKLNGQLIKNTENSSFAKANNQAVKIAKGNFLLLLNNDTVVTNNFIEEMMKVFSEEKAVGAVGARLVHPGKGTIQHGGLFELSSGMPDHAYFGFPMNHPKVLKREQCFGATGACLLTPKQLYKELGGLDEIFVNGWEDCDYMQRLRKNGYRVYYEPKALVYHYESRTKGRYANESANFGTYMKRWVFQ